MIEFRWACETIQFDEVFTLDELDYQHKFR